MTDPGATSAPSGLRRVLLTGGSGLVGRTLLPLRSAPPVPAWYTVAKARRLLGYAPQFNFSVQPEETP